MSWWNKRRKDGGKQRGKKNRRWDGGNQDERLNRRKSGQGWGGRQGVGWGGREGSYKVHLWREGGENSEERTLLNRRGSQGISYFSKHILNKTQTRRVGVEIKKMQDKNWKKKTEAAKGEGDVYSLQSLCTEFMFSFNMQEFPLRRFISFCIVILVADWDQVRVSGGIIQTASNTFLLIHFLITSKTTRPGVFRRRRGKTLALLLESVPPAWQDAPANTVGGGNIMPWSLTWWLLLHKHYFILENTINIFLFWSYIRMSILEMFILAWMFIFDIGNSGLTKNKKQNKEKQTQGPRFSFFCF